ncbi:polysaccharide biosynthesis tyrosine autokinase [Massilia sp. LXY-6]|uniref:polysaccharide biosynthesis tyrosine autokinase n=1 Tax=Massilia sp. LXY-6 TaxID=3379823 RepID=UPI003EE33B68
MNDMTHLLREQERKSTARPAEEPQPIGRMLQTLRGLSDQQIEEIVEYQRVHGMRFGEAAVALRLASDGDIVELISRQFHYPYDSNPDASSALPAELVVAKNPFSDGAEIIRDLRTQLLMGMTGVEGQRLTLAVTSAQTGDGKTFVATNLAAAFSQLGTRTLLIDANMRKPRAGSVFGVPDGSPGLSTILSGRVLKYALHQVAPLPNLFILAAGPVPPNPQELLQGASFELLLDELQKEFDHIVIDTSASESGSDFRMVAARTAATLVVARQGSTSYNALAAVVQTLARSSTTLAGVVMNSY